MYPWHIYIYMTKSNISWMIKVENTKTMKLCLKEKHILLLHLKLNSKFIFSVALITFQILSSHMWLVRRLTNKTFCKSDGVNARKKNPHFSKVLLFPFQPQFWFLSLKIRNRWTKFIFKEKINFSSRWQPFKILI